MQVLKIFWNILKPILLIYLLYVLITAVFIFTKEYEPTEASDAMIDTSQYYGEGIGPDRAAIIEDRQLALKTRFYLLEEAEESVKIANYSIYPGEVSDLFYGLILDTANRGVDVQLLFNGIAHNLHGPANQTYWALVNHPNISLRFYEPLNLLKPWTFNNRMHDKFWVIDETHALSGGRNIADKYYLEEYEGPYVYDRDILVYNTEPESKESVLAEFHAYFDSLWDHEFTKAETPSQASFFQNAGQKGEAALLAQLKESRSNEDYEPGSSIDWVSHTMPTRQISLITNPLERMKKSPVVLKTLNALMMEAESYVLAQSPYLVINEELQRILDVEQSEAEFHVLTNSQYSTPNFPAMAGMLNYRDPLLNGSTQVYGYQGDGSIHAKSYVVDGRLSMVGSFNLDPRSAFLSTENLVIVDSEPVTQALTKNIQEKITESRIYNKEAPVLTETIEAPKEVLTVKEVIISISQVLFHPFDELL